MLSGEGQTRDLKQGSHLLISERVELLELGLVNERAKVFGLLELQQRKSKGDEKERRKGGEYLLRLCQ